MTIINRTDTEITVERFPINVTAPASHVRNAKPRTVYFGTEEMRDRQVDYYAGHNHAVEVLPAVQHTLRVGDRIETSAFGRIREGVVNKIGRSRVQVTIVRNQQGDKHSGAYDANLVYPAGSHRD